MKRPAADMKRAPFACLTLFAVGLLAGCSQTVVVEDRPGATSAQSTADHNACHEKVKNQPDLYVPQQTTLAGAAGAGAIQGATSVIQEEQAVSVCMEQMGYTKRTLSPEESKQIRALPRGPARERAIDAVMKANDL